MKKFYKGFCIAEEAVCCAGFAAMVLLVFVSAVARGLSTPIQWSIDIAQLLLCWTTLIGADVAYRKHRFLGLDLITRHFPLKVRRVIDIVLDLLMLAMLVILIIYGVKLTISSWMRQFQTLKLSYSFVTMALPVMSFLLSITIIIETVTRIRNFNAPEIKSDDIQNGGKEA